MKTRNHTHLFPIIDAMVDSAVNEIESEGKKVTCQKGCDHCCHLLIEVSWEEALELGHWVLEQPQNVQESFVSRIKTNSREAKEFFLSTKKGAIAAKPIKVEIELDEQVYDNYFYQKKRPCPFLVEGACSAYSARPTSCRMHMVSSDPALCSANCHDDDDYDIPDSVEELQENASHVIGAVEKDGRWGHFGIMVEEAYNYLKSQESNTHIAA